MRLDEDGDNGANNREQRAGAKSFWLSFCVEIGGSSENPAEQRMIRSASRKTSRPLIPTTMLWGELPGIHGAVSGLHRHLQGSGHRHHRRRGQAGTHPHQRARNRWLGTRPEERKDAGASRPKRTTTSWRRGSNDSTTRARPCAPSLRRLTSR